MLLALCLIQVVVVDVANQCNPIRLGAILAVVYTAIQKMSENSLL